MSDDTDGGDAVELWRDPVSFEAPYVAAVAACTTVLTNSVRKVAGAEAALHQAMDDHTALQAFDKAVDQCVEEGTFHELPAVKNRGRRIPGLHQLTRGRFRGVFLIGKDVTQVVGLVFSREPHDLSARLAELVTEHRTAADNAAENEGEG